MALSRQLNQKKSMTNIHADLPFGTPPAKDMRFSLTNMSMLDQQTAIRRRKRPTNGSNTTDDTVSAFSCPGDLLPDESSMHVNHNSQTGEEQDMADVENIANALAKRRGIAPSHVLPQLLDLFGANSNGILTICLARDCLLTTISVFRNCESYMQYAKHVDTFNRAALRSSQASPRCWNRQTCDGHDESF